MAFTGRAEGNVSLVVGPRDPVGGARARLAGLVGLAPRNLVFMEQVHGADVARVGAAQRGRGLDDHGDALPRADALVTTEPDVGLVVLVADCVPVLLAADGQGAAAVHAGRRGVEQGIVPAAVAALGAASGVAPGRMRARIGPAIGGCCYEVPEELAARVAKAVPATATRTHAGTPGLDLPAGVAAQLQEAGVAEIEALGSCTRCETGRWFSHRGAADGPGAGRQAGVVCLAGAA